MKFKFLYIPFLVGISYTLSMTNHQDVESYSIYLESLGSKIPIERLLVISGELFAIRSQLDFKDKSAVSKWMRARMIVGKMLYDNESDIKKTGNLYFKTVLIFGLSGGSGGRTEAHDQIIESFYKNPIEVLEFLIYLENDKKVKDFGYDDILNSTLELITVTSKNGRKVSAQWQSRAYTIFMRNPNSGYLSKIHSVF